MTRIAAVGDTSSASPPPPDPTAAWDDAVRSALSSSPGSSDSSADTDGVEPDDTSEPLLAQNGAPGGNTTQADTPIRLAGYPGFGQTLQPLALQAGGKPGDTGGQVKAIVAKAQAETDPNKALQVLNQGYTHATPDVQAALLKDPGAGKIISRAAEWANAPLTAQQGGAVFPQSRTVQALRRLDQLTQGVDKALGGAVAAQAAPGYATFANQPSNGGQPAFGPGGVTSLMSIAGHIKGTPAGDAAIGRFAAAGAWNTDAVRNSIAQGADPAYALAYAAHMQAIDGDGSGVLQTVMDGVAGFKQKTKDDVTALAQHDSELAWLVQKDGAGMTPQQLNQAVAAYRASKGPDWERQEAALNQQISKDGSQLLTQMMALNQAAPQLKGSSASVNDTLKTIVNDKAANLAISTAIQTDPNLVKPQNALQLADLFTLSKVGEAGRKLSNEAAASYVKQNVLADVQGTDLTSRSSVAQTKQAIDHLEDEPVAKLLGISPKAAEEAVQALDTAVDKAAANPNDPSGALQDLDEKLGSNPELKAFDKSTLPGQLFRGVGLAFAGASVLNSASKVQASGDPQNKIKLLVDVSGFAQKSADLLVGLGKVNEQSLVGQFGGGAKLGKATAGDLIGGISAVLDAVSAVRSGFGLGVPQDTGAAVFSATTSVGGGLAAAAPFVEASWLGPVGLGITAVGVVGSAIYQQVKDAHQYEGASKAFLQAAGYNSNAADALSKQDGVISGASGAAQMPFLAKYAQLKHLTPNQMMAWVNHLTPGQVHNLGLSLLMVAGDCHGDPSQFTDGPIQTAVVGGEFPAVIPVSNTVTAFEQQLAYDHVPHP